MDSLFAAFGWRNGSQLRRQLMLVWMLTAVVVIAVKYHYSVAGPDDLRWVLSPTTYLVELFWSVNFIFDPAKGYVATELPVVIGPGCAGLNFFVISLSMSVFTFIGGFKRRMLYGWFMFLLMNYLVTLLVNAFRIIGGVVLLQIGNDFGFDAGGVVHSAQGTLFYFVFLVGYFVTLRYVVDAMEKK